MRVSPVLLRCGMRRFLISLDASAALRLLCATRENTARKHRLKCSGWILSQLTFFFVVTSNRVGRWCWCSIP